MSTYAELEIRCKRRLGRRGMTITTEFLDEMQSAQERLEKGTSLPKFLKLRVPGLSSAGGQFFSLPSDFIRMYDDYGFSWNINNGAEQHAVRLDTLQQLDSKINAGIPEGQLYYYIDGNGLTSRIRMNPLTEDINYTLRYYGKEVVLNGGNDNKWTTGPQAEYIMALAGMELANWLRDDRALKYFTDLVSGERRTMHNQIEADEWGDTDLVMGDPD